MNQTKYAELFASEAREHLALIARSLVALESEPGDQESLDAIFRSAHTIKGMAAAMGYSVVTRLAHSFESALERLRGHETPVDAQVIDLLLECSDRLEEAVDITEAGGEAPDPSSLIERLANLNESAAEPGARGRPARQAATGMDAEHRQRRSRTARVGVDIRRLDNLMNQVGELMIVRSRLGALATELSSEPLQDAVERAGGIIRDIQAEVVESRMVPVWQVFDRFPRLVRDIARQEGKEVELEISGKGLELDRSLLDAITDPLIHLLRNAVDHGIESPKERESLGKPRAGRIHVSAQRERSRVVITVEDDGRGVDRQAAIARARESGTLDPNREPTDQELFRILARPGFTTAERVTTLSGRGVGLNVVDDCTRALGGSIELSTEPGAGTLIRLELPLTVAIVHAVMVEVMGETYGLPVRFAREIFEITEEDVEVAHGREWISWRDERVPLQRLRRLFNGGASSGGSTGSDGNGRTLKLVALEFGGERIAIAVDRFLGEQEVVVKTFDPPLGALSVFSAATVRPDGRPALLLDVGSLSG